MGRTGVITYPDVISVTFDENVCATSRQGNPGSQLSNETLIRHVGYGPIW